jgi:hypothetical protein
MIFVEGNGFKVGITSMFDGFSRVGDICIEYEDAPVFFMLSKRRKAIEIVHIGTKGRAGKLGLRDAGRRLIEYVTTSYPWCEMLLALISIKSLYNACKKVGFMDCGLVGNKAGTLNLMAVNYGRRG